MCLLSQLVITEYTQNTSPPPSKSQERLFTKTIAMYFKNHMGKTDTVCEQNEDFFIITERCTLCLIIEGFKVRPQIFCLEEMRTF
jgi:hypothetical protein